MNTYIINLDKDVKRWNLIYNRLLKTDLKDNIIRFPAIHINTLSDDKIKEITTTNAYYFCPKIAIAICYSHFQLIKNIYHTDNNNYALILEDDIIPLRNELLPYIKNIVNNPQYKNWDIIRLFCQGFYPNKKEYSFLSKIFSGSAAAYLISKKGQQKFLDKKIKYHADIQQNLDNDLILYKNYDKKNSLFTINTTETGSSQSSMNMKFLNNIKVGDVPLSYSLSFPVVRIPFLDINISIFGLIIIIIVIVIIIAIWIKNKYNLYKK